MKPVSIFNNRIPARDLAKLRTNNMSCERRDLADQIVQSQEALKISRDMRLNEDEIVRIPVRVLVKLNEILKQIEERYVG